MTTDNKALADLLLAFEGSDALGNGDFSLLREAAAALTREPSTPSAQAVGHVCRDVSQARMIVNLPEGTALYTPSAQTGNEFFVVPEGLHPNTANLVARFATALAAKLAKAEAKYGYSDNWARTDWADECRAHLLNHVQKGDPCDVAAYCAFLWHHGESTTPQPQGDASGQVSGGSYDGLCPDCREIECSDECMAQVSGGGINLLDSVMDEMRLRAEEDTHEARWLKKLTKLRTALSTPKARPDGGEAVDRALVAFHQHESGPCEFPDRKNPEFNANQRERMAAALAAVQRGQPHDGCGCDSSEGEACEKCCPSMRPQVSHSGEPFGHLYRVVAGPDHPSARAPWSSKDTVFEAGPAPFEGVRGSIQYRNLYHPTPAPDAVAQLVKSATKTERHLSRHERENGWRDGEQQRLNELREALAPFIAAQQGGES